MAPTHSPSPFDPDPATRWTEHRDGREASCVARFVPPSGIQVEIRRCDRPLMAMTFANSDEAVAWAEEERQRSLEHPRERDKGGDLRPNAVGARSMSEDTRSAASSGGAMKRGFACCVGVLACALMASPAYAQDARQFTSDTALLRFLDELAEATHQFNVGNPQPYLALLSPREDLTLMGAAGGMEKGIAQIKPRLEFLTKRRTQGERFQENRAVIEYVSIFAAGDIAYTVQIERRKLSAAGQNQAKDDVLRATHVLRQENGQWRLVHRHADSLVAVTVPGLPTPRPQ